MPQILRTTVGQFSTSGGRWQPRAINVRAVEPAPDLPSAERGSLYMLIEVTGDGHTALYRQMLNAAQTAFYEMGTSVDAALRQAARSVHAVLRRANEALTEAQWRGGMSLVVRYGSHLVIAQAGPSLVLVSHPKTIEQFPAQLGDWGVALGGEERPDISIYETTVEPGSMVLMAQSTWPDQVALEALAVAAAAPDVNLATQYLAQLAGKADLSALLIGFVRDIPEVRMTPPPTLGSKTPAQPAPTPVLTPAEPPATAAKGAPAAGRPLSLDRDADEDAPSPVTEPGPPAEPLPAQPSPRGRPSIKLPPMPRPRPPAPAPESLPYLEPDFAPAATEAAPIERPAPGRRSIWPVIALAVIPLLIIGVVLAMLYVRNRAAETQLTQALEGAAAVLTQAETAQDDTLAGQRLGEARDFLDKARALRATDSRIAELQARYQAVQDRIQKVTPLYGLVPLWDFKDPAQRLDRVLASGDSLFVLDHGAHAAYRFTRSALGDSVNPPGDPIISKGQTVKDLIVSELVDLAWIEAAGANQRSKLVALDTAKGLLSYDVTWGVGRLPLAGSDKLAQPQLVSGYGGNLYIADPGASQIWRYRPGATGFENEPEPYFAEDRRVNMAGLQDMAIDGNVWLLFADGQALKFFAGEQRPLIWQGFPDPPNAPTALAVPQEGDRLYLADAGNNRIVEATKDGKFLRQFRARDSDDLRNVRSLFIDEAGAMFYILTTDKLYKADVPASETTTSTGATN